MVMEETFEPAIPLWVYPVVVAILAILILFRMPVIALIFLNKWVRYGIYAFIVATAIYIAWMLYG
jgi:hypothetical protein